MHENSGSKRKQRGILFALLGVAILLAARSAVSQGQSMLLREANLALRENRYVDAIAYFRALALLDPTIRDDVDRLNLVNTKIGEVQARLCGPPPHSTGLTAGIPELEIVTSAQLQLCPLQPSSSFAPQPSSAAQPQVSPGLPSGHRMTACACWGPNPVQPVAEPRCASGIVRVEICGGWCAPGHPVYAYSCG
jgi:hypothetical protein